MNTGQMMLTIFGMILLSTLVLNMNNTYYDTSSSISRNKFDVMAVEIATSYLESIKNSNRFSFDENTKTSYITNSNNLSTIGRDGVSEVRTNYNVHKFDDIDDFNNDTTSIILDSGVGTSKVTYYIRGQVEYFDPSTYSTTISRKFHKKVTVKVVSNTLDYSLRSDTVKLSTIISYWKFR